MSYLVSDSKAEHILLLESDGPKEKEDDEEIEQVNADVSVLKDDISFERKTLNPSRELRERL